ncbi:hypothetical protein BJ165DRAFT_25469 [Panaeolus papilionaceus]|nr:hypothetical protein BJ165DRAFT_25469 [Panaeolus papilionaceus]
MHQPGVVPPTPILDPPLPIGDQATVERIRQLYGQMTSNFSRDVKRSSGPTTNGHPTLGGPSPVAGAANGPNNHSPTHSNNAGTPTLPGHVPSFVAPSSTPTPTPLSAGSSTSNLKRDRTDDASGVDGGSAHKRRDTGEGKTPSNGSVRSTPTPTPVLQQQQHMLQQNQLGQNQLNQNSMPPPSTIPISNQVGQSSTPTPTNITPTSGPTSFSVPMSGGTGGRQTRQPTPSTPTSTSPIGGMSSDPSSTAANSVVNNQSSSSGMTPSLAQSQDLQGLNLNINNPVEAQIAAQNRERVRQAQIHQAQQHAIRMNNRMAGGQSGGMSGGGNVGAGGQGGMTGAGGLNPGMLNQQGSQTSGMGGIVPSGGNMGINPPGMGGNGLAQNASGGSGGPQPNQAQIQQALLQILNTPNHPILRFCLQNVPNFENLPTQMQLQKLFAARNHLQQQQQQQMARNGMQNAMQGGQNPAGMNMPGAAGAGGNSLTPQQILQLQQRQQQQMGQGSFSAGTNGPMSPIQHGAIPQNLQNQMVNLGGNQGMPGGGSSGMGMNMSGAGGGGMDPRLSMSNPGGGGNLNPHQRQLLLLQQQQRHAGGGAGSSNMGGGGNPGMGGAGGQFGNMNPGNAAMFTPQQQLAMQIRQQQLNAAAGASSPTHSSSPMGSEFPAGSMSGVGMGIPPNMRGPGTIPGIARSTRSPSDSGPSPMTPRGPPQRVPSMSQEDYNRVMLQQQQQQRNLAAPNPGGFNPHMMGGGGGGNWGQGGGGGGGGSQGQGGSNFGMSPPGSATSTSFGNINAPSPTGGQNWGGPGQGGGGMNVGGYPFSASPVGSDFSRHMAGTPGPQQQRQATPQTSPPTDLMSQDFELLNWNNQ